MDYHKHYDRLISRAKTRKPLEGYKERHHIKPKCMGGDDDPDNIVELTGREHYIAHQLLLKMYPDNYKLAYATKILMGSKNYNNRQFEWIRKRAVEASVKFHTGRKRSQQTKDRISAAMKGKTKNVPKPAGFGKKISKALKGRVLSESHRENLSKRIITDEWRSNLSKANKARVLINHSEKIKLGMTDEVKAKISHMAKNRKPVKCEYCGKQCSPGNHKRWHGENCKENPNGL